MAGPFGVSPGAQGSYAFRAAPVGNIQMRPLPVPLATPLATPPPAFNRQPLISNGIRPMPGLQAPSPLVGVSPVRPPVLVPGGQPNSPIGSIPGRPLPTGPTTGLPNPGANYPGYPGRTPPGTNQYPATNTTGTPNGQCGMFNNWGLIGFFDHTVGAVVKQLLGLRDTCTQMTPGQTLGQGYTAMPMGPRAFR